MSKVRLEILSWLAEALDIEKASDTVSLEQEIEDGKTARDLLNRLATGHQRFGQMVFDINAQKLTGKVIIFFNGRTLETVNGLETKLSDGDTLTFVPIIEGG